MSCSGKSNSAIHLYSLTSSPPPSFPSYIQNFLLADSVPTVRTPHAAVAVDEGRASLMEAIRLAGGSNQAGLPWKLLIIAQESQHTTINIWDISSLITSVQHSGCCWEDMANRMISCLLFENVNLLSYIDRVDILESCTFLIMI
jgi:hypothetical protein